MIKLLKMQKNKGFTYVELIVVLAIFAVMSSIVLFNYGEFQAKVDIKTLASDIALKIVEAQKSAMSGKQVAGSLPDWKPAYGVYFKLTDNTHFIYFADINPIYDSYDVGEELETVFITKNNSISNIDKCITDSCTPGDSPISFFTITFRRPDSKAIFTSSSGSPIDMSGFNYIQITIKSPRSDTAIAKIKIYPSGRVQVN